MRKITFERVVLGIFILIILISTSDITGKYIKVFLKKFDKPLISSVPSRSSGFPTMLMNADTLFKEGDYEGAAEEYITMTLNSTLNSQQRAHAYFNLGVCQFNLKKYDSAFDSFISVNSYSSDDSVAYNNAAVSAFRAKDINSAIELQKKALSILPAVEYYYNLARMYEDIEEYELAANNYSIVAEGEQNLTKVEKIDPVRVKDKAARLTSTKPASIKEAESNALYVYKLEDNRAIFTINENEMQVKQGDFIVRVENRKSSKSIVAEYDRKKYDPYNLISELLWTVYKDGKAIYKKSSDNINIRTSDTGIYEVKLNIKYNGNKEMSSTKTVTLNPSTSTVGIAVQDDIKTTTPISTNTKTYEYALYEQLFESDFEVISTGYTDKYNVVWGKDSIAVGLTKESSVDKASSLSIRNTLYKKQGIWVILDSLLKDEAIVDKNISISFYAKKVSPNASINMIVRVKSNNVISTVPKNFILSSSWEQKSVSVFIPKEATSFTITLVTSPDEQFDIDRFVIVE
jgi:tetratricopeptide (TPR) repeat protein